MRTFIFIILCAIGIGIGAQLGTYIFFGIMTLCGIIFLIESNDWLKRLVERSVTFVDVIIFGLTIAATVSMGVTIAGSLTVAGLGFTLVYAPYVRNRRYAREEEEHSKRRRL